MVAMAFKYRKLNSFIDNLFNWTKNEALGTTPLAYCVGNRPVVGGLIDKVSVMCSMPRRFYDFWIGYGYPDSKVHGANMGPTWVLSAPCGPYVGPMKFAIWVSYP